MYGTVWQHPIRLSGGLNAGSPVAQREGAAIAERCGWAHNAQRASESRERELCGPVLRTTALY